jgi:antitoxin PrlF
MKAYATMTSKGQMTLPVEVRRELKLAPGDRVEVTVAGGTATLRKKSGSFEDLRGIIKVEGAAANLDQWIEEARAAIAAGVRE